MNLSRKWLSTYVSIEDISDQSLADLLTSAGLEVEGFAPLVETNDVIIGYVLECHDHPDSDHLHVTKVDVGSEVLDIVCGAANVAKDQKVIVAKVGTTVGDLHIQPIKLRGVLSSGMICSYKELGVPEKFISEEQSEGIAVLEADAPIGENAIAYLGLDDVIFDVSLTPNRSDVLAMNALAKEVGALLKRDVVLPQNKEVTTTKNTPLTLASTTKNCTQFLGRIIERVTIKESPAWLKEILVANNIRPINNVVDISNVVMLETGQPCHFYDRKLISDEITVKDNMQLDYVALDEETYRIEKEDVLITSNDEVIGIAGIMGGDSSKISDSTTSLILEMASFDRVAIRQSSRRLNLLTEAATRFIKGIDPQAIITAMDRATTLLVELADAQIIHPVVSLAPISVKQRKVSVSKQHIVSLLGIELEDNTIMDVLKALSFNPQYNEGVFECTIPSYRQDISIAADLIEEIIRLIGYDVITSKPLHLSETSGRLSIKQQYLRKFKQVALGFNLHEVITYTLINPTMALGPMALANPVSILSPLSEDRKTVRNQLFASVLSTIAYNHRYKNSPNNVFEISEVYGENKQETRLVIALTEDVVALEFKQERISASFYALKGMLEAFIGQCGVDISKLVVKAVAEDQVYLHPYQSAIAMLDKVMVGYLGKVHPTYAQQVDAPTTWIMEINVDALLAFPKMSNYVQSLNKFPTVEKDLAFVMDKDTSLSDFKTLIKEAGAPFVEDVFIFDVFESEKLGENKHSIAFNVRFVANQMYRDEQINDILTNIIEKAKTNTGATLR